MVALRRNSHLAQAVRKAHRFALNILAEDQQELASGSSPTTPRPG